MSHAPHLPLDRQGPESRVQMLNDHQNYPHGNYHPVMQDAEAQLRSKSHQRPFLEGALFLTPLFYKFGTSHPNSSPTHQKLTYFRGNDCPKPLLDHAKHFVRNRCSEGNYHQILL